MYATFVVVLLAILNIVAIVRIPKVVKQAFHELLLVKRVRNIRLDISLVVQLVGVIAHLRVVIVGSSTEAKSLFMDQVSIFIVGFVVVFDVAIVSVLVVKAGV